MEDETLITNLSLLLISALVTLGKRNSDIRP